MSARPRRILVGYDGTDAAERALDAATELMGYGSTIAVLSVEDGNGTGPSTIDRARARLQKRRVTALYLQARGDPADNLVSTAADLGADLVVVGRRDLDAEGRSVLGSVSSEVVTYASCDVLVVR